MKEKIWTLGILVAPGDIDGEAKAHGNAQRPPEERLCRALSLRAPAYGMRVIVFSATGFDEENRRLWGWQLRHDAWQHMPVPLPDIVYNRSFCASPEERRRSRDGLLALSRHHSWISLGGQLPGKLRVDRWLRSEPDSRRLLPPSALLKDTTQLLQWLAAYPGGLFVKPDGGMQGRGAMKLSRSARGLPLLLEGRTRTNQSFRLSSLPENVMEQIRSIGGRGRYVMQPFLQLSDPEGRPFDLRVLVQKDGSGRWSLTGSAVRRGTADSITSNLHGGGEAISAAPALTQWFGSERAAQLLPELTDVSLRLAARLEERAGRLVELGLDYGLDRSGRLWLLEANSKPGRRIFALTDDQVADERSVHRPLQYARALVDRKPRCGNNFQEVHS
ncbi:YheC/YheD family protein [Paenibacillus daejeonensis]|uniref:YheC/YheD family endospore coat-associated protein n=1 Tax=Paenibacillus daejeonensis TaxID=135193 RepID=UPI00037C74EC|nr:YheC/YheD family protein [Paenibacillus daejeonensis]